MKVQWKSRPGKGGKRKGTERKRGKEVYRLSEKGEGGKERVCEERERGSVKRERERGKGAKERGGERGARGRQRDINKGRERSRSVSYTHLRAHET